MTEEEYFELDNLWIIGIIGGIIGAMWKIIPYFITTPWNPWILTVPAGLLIAVIPLPSDKLWKGVSVAAGTYLLMTWIIIPVGAGALAGNSQQSPPAPQDTNVKKVVLNVPDMYCEGCVYTVENTLKSMPGVTRAKASLSKKEAIVYYKPDKTSPQKIVKNPTIQGYGGTIKKK